MEGRFNGGFFALPVWRAYFWRGLYPEGLIFGILRYFCVEVINSKRQLRGKLGHVVKNSRLPFGVNVNLNPSNNSIQRLYSPEIIDVP